MRAAYLLLFLTCFSSAAETARLSIGVTENFLTVTSAKAIHRLNAAAERSGLTLEFKFLPPKRSLLLASEGMIDGLALRHAVIEDSSPSLLRVDSAIEEVNYQVWLLENNECMQNKEELVRLKPVGQKGAQFFDSLVYPRSQVGYEAVDTPERIAQMLQRGRADYTVHRKSVMENVSRKTGIKLKSCLDEPLVTLPFYIYLHESKRQLAYRLEQTLKIVQ